MWRRSGVVQLVSSPVAGIHISHFVLPVNYVLLIGLRDCGCTCDFGVELGSEVCACVTVQQEVLLCLHL